MCDRALSLRDNFGTFERVEISQIFRVHVSVIPLAPHHLETKGRARMRPTDLQPLMFQDRRFLEEEDADGKRTRDGLE